MNQKQKFVIVAAALLIISLCFVNFATGLFSPNESSTQNATYDSGDYRYHLIPMETEEVSEAPLGIAK